MRGAAVLVVLSVLALVALVQVTLVARRNKGWTATLGRAFTVREERWRTFALLGLAAALTAGSAVVGISDNPKGLLLAFGAVAAAAVAVVHPLRWARPYEILLLGGCLGLIGGAVLHNVFDAAAQIVPFLRFPMEALSVVFFLLAVLASPSLIVVGIIGALYFHAKAAWQRKATHS